MTDDAELVLAARAGERDAFAALVDRWFDRCWEVAWRILHDRDLAADVAQDTLLVAWRRVGELDRPASFGGWVLRIARNRALDRLKRERRMRPTGDDAQLEPDVRTRPDAGPEAALARGQQRDMVWAAAAALGERDASMLDLHLRHGLEPAELADELGVQPNAAHQRLFRLRKRLGEAIGAWVLWRRGTPSCPDLATAVTQLGHAGFDRTTAQAIWRHARTCDTCESTRQLLLDPSTLFAAIPLVVPPSALRAKAIAALQAQGIPTGLTSTAPGASGPADSSVNDAPQPPTDDPNPHDPANRPEDASPTERDDVPSSQARSHPRRALRRAIAAAAIALVIALLFASTRQGGDNTDQAASDRTEADDQPTGLPRRGDTDSTTTSAPTTAPTTSLTLPPTATSGPPSETAPPTTAAPPSTDTTPSTEPLPERPTIGGFRTTSGQQACPPNEVAVVFVWNTTGADEVTLGPTGGSPTTVATSGTTQACATPSTPWTLTATNAGGSTTATATTPPAPLPIP